MPTPCTNCGKDTNGNVCPVGGCDLCFKCFKAWLDRERNKDVSPSEVPCGICQAMTTGKNVLGKEPMCDDCHNQAVDDLFVSSQS